MRVKEGLDAYVASTDAQRAQIVKGFRIAKGDFMERRATYVDAAKQVLVRREQRRKESLMIAANFREATGLSKGADVKR